MIDRLSLGALSPARRADVIYQNARAELDQRLWQAALGGRDDPQPAVPAATPQRLTLDALLQDFAAPERGEPIAVGESVAENVADATITSTAVAPAGLGANARHAATLEAAAERTGIPSNALAAIVDAEAAKTRNGSWNTLSRNPRSSAAGLGQFLSRTWEGLAETRGTWLNEVARSNGWLNAAGQVTGTSRAAVLALRYDSVAAINGVADFARRNLDGLKRAGVPIDGDVGGTARLAYLGHHLGLGDAARFLRKGGLSEGRARVLLDAQVGGSASQKRIVAAAGDATAAHRAWLLGYLDRKIQPERFTANA